MSIIKWRKETDIDNLFENLSNSFPFKKNKKNNEKDIDIYEEGDNIIVKVDLLGIKPEKVKMDIDGDYLHISGKNDEEIEEDEEDFHIRKMQCNSFERLIYLPDMVNRKKIIAESDDGFLKVIIPKGVDFDDSSREIDIKIK